MGILSSIFGGDDGASAAEEQEKKYLQPYQDAGLAAGKTLSGAYQNLMNPNTLMSKWMSSYQESPEARNLAAQSRSQGMDEASSMGLMGSSPALRAIQSGTSGILANDQQNYLHNMMNQYLAGTGIASNMYGIGSQIGEHMGDEMATLAAKKSGGLMSGLGSLVGGIAGYVGGLPGVGSAIGSKVGGMIKDL